MKLFLSREKFHNVLEEMFWGEEECRDMEEVWETREFQERAIRKNDWFFLPSRVNKNKNLGGAG